MAHIYLAQWEWHTDESGTYWRAPGGNAIGVIDFRGPVKAGKAGPLPDGYGVFVYSGAQAIANSVYLGESLGRRLNTIEKDEVRVRLGLPERPTSNTVLDFLWDVLTKYADVTGETRTKGITPTWDSRLELHLGGFSKIREEAFDIKTHPYGPVLIKQHQEHYRQVRQRHLSDYPESDPQRHAYRVILRKWARRYGVPYRTFLAPDLPDEGLR